MVEFGFLAETDEIDVALCMTSKIDEKIYLLVAIRSLIPCVSCPFISPYSLQLMYQMNDNIE